MRLSLLVSAFALLAQPYVLADLAYCATENTGTTDATTDTYQSNGACTKSCSGYALGVLQGKKCWCTNVAPSEKSQESTSKCSTACPGYPKDSCGSASDGVYAYVAVSGDPTSTAGDSSSAASSAHTSTTSTTTSTTSTPSSARVSTTTDSSSTTNSVSLETNSGGQVKTITVGSSSATAGADGANLKGADEKGSKLSGGSIAGVVIGVVGGLALVGALIFLVFFYRKRAARASSPTPSQDMADRHSQGSGFSHGVFPQGQGAAGSSLGRQTTFTDNRMKNTIYPNGRRDSSVSLQDNEDYSRPVLRVTNAD